ncbi:MAG: amino acid-binding protein [Haloferacaceae archaeon]
MTDRDGRDADRGVDGRPPAGGSNGSDSETLRANTDGGQVASRSTHTVRLELVDEPGELLRALGPISDNGGNLLSIYHERGNITPRGHIPVEIDLEATEEQFEAIVEALREAGVNVMQAGTERYSEELTLVLVGHLIDSDLSDTLRRVEDCAAASVADVSLSAPEGTERSSSARLRLATREGETGRALEVVRSIADEKGLNVIEPLVGVEP